MKIYSPSTRNPKPGLQFPKADGFMQVFLGSMLTGGVFLGCQRSPFQGGNASPTCRDTADPPPTGFLRLCGISSSKSNDDQPRPVRAIRQNHWKSGQIIAPIYNTFWVGKLAIFAVCFDQIPLPQTTTPQETTWIHARMQIRMHAGIHSSTPITYRKLI